MCGLVAFIVMEALVPYHFVCALKLGILAYMEWESWVILHVFNFVVFVINSLVSKHALVNEQSIRVPLRV